MQTYNKRIFDNKNTLAHTIENVANHEQQIGELEDKVASLLEAHDELSKMGNRHDELLRSFVVHK